MRVGELTRMRSGERGEPGDPLDIGAEPRMVCCGG